MLSPSCKEWIKTELNRCADFTKDILRENLFLFCDHRKHSTGSKCWSRSWQRYKDLFHPPRRLQTPAHTHVHWTARQTDKSVKQTNEQTFFLFCDHRKHSIGSKCWSRSWQHYRDLFHPPRKLQILADNQVTLNSQTNRQMNRQLDEKIFSCFTFMTTGSTPQGANAGA